MNSQYSKARKTAKREFNKAVVRGEYPYVPSLDMILDDFSILPKKRIGVMEIPVDMIVGTANTSRALLFGYDFLPLGEDDSEFAKKWEDVFTHQEKDGLNEPIKVYEFKHLFYVEEGNKRVSVLKYMDIPSVMAEVHRLMPKDTDAFYEEFISFFDSVGIYDIYFKTVGNYNKLSKLFGYKAGQKWKTEDVVKLRNAYYRFLSIAKETIKHKNSMVYSEAFLIYLEVYGLESTYSIQPDEINSIVKELNRIEQKETHAFIEQPLKENQSTLRSIKNLVPRKHSRTKVAFVYDADSFLSANVFMHELGRLMMNEKMQDQIDCQRYENGNETVIDKAIQDGAKIVFTTTPELYEDTFKAAIKHTDTKFYNCSLYRAHASVETYDVKMYEVKFLMGALAAMLAKNHTLGYIADAPVYGTIANINAFALGASMIDPYAKIYLGWKETLDQDWQNQMRILGVEVFSGPELPSFDQYSTEYGLYRLEESEVIQLASPLIHWDIYYEKLLNQYLNDVRDVAKGKAVSYWWGIGSGVLDLALSSRIPTASKKMIESLKHSIKEEIIHPFKDELYTNDDHCANVEGCLSAEEIITMHWLNQNVIGIIPMYEELTEHGKHLIKIHGVYL